MRCLRSCVFLDRFNYFSEQFIYSGIVELRGDGSYNG